MAKRIGVLEASEPLDAEPRSHCSKNAAAYLIRKLLAVQVPGRRVIKKLPQIAEAVYQQVRAFWDGPLGVGNALPFSPRTDPTKHYHYEVPPAGCTGLWRHFRKRIQVSARPQSHLAAQFLRRTQQNAPRRLADALS